MSPFLIFLTQFVLSFLGYAWIAAIYVAPRLLSLPLPDALTPLLFLHAFRHLGLVFLVPAVVAPGLPRAFALPAAYGDLVSGLLAFVAIWALRAAQPLAMPLVWLFNIVGTADLLLALTLGTRYDVGGYLGAAWLVPTFVVPALLITHALIFALLVRAAR